ncbi:hypothetical protein H0H92_010265 [Tricholoma furcatifolium]|nr:hypothetical protein H0H92_010265 [Tricholoma furcatifolium]
MPPFRMSCSEYTDGGCLFIADRNDVIIAIVGGRPNDPTYVEAADELLELMKTSYEAERGRFDDDRKSSVHRRGAFPALNVGTMYGMGTTAPTQLNNGRFTGLVNKIIRSEPFQRLMPYGSATVQIWAPRLYEYLHSHLNWIWDQGYPGVFKICPRSVFPTAALNFGGKVRTFKHRDCMNLPFSFCNILALGKFDPLVSAELILWELGLIVPLPHAISINILSACTTHSNTEVQDGDYRVSVTQYCPGDLIRWVHNHGQTEKQLEKADFKEWTRLQGLKCSRWEDGAALLSTKAELTALL